MAHTYGLLELPLQASLDRDAVGDPVLDVFAEAIPTILNYWCGAAWQAMAPTEPLFRTVFKHDPHPDDFLEKNLPSLFLYRDEEPLKDYTDALNIVESTIYACWVAPPAQQEKRAVRQAFLNAIAKGFSELINLERHPVWVRAGDTSQASKAYGTNITIAAQLDGWFLKGVNRHVLEIPVPTAEGGYRRYSGFIASIVVRESNTDDPVQQGFVETELHQQVSPVFVDAGAATSGTLLLDSSSFVIVDGSNFVEVV